MQTEKRFPRTMEEAFGPGHRGGIYEPYPQMDLVDKIICSVSAVIIVGLRALIVMGVI